MVYLKSKITVWNDSHLLPVNILRDKTVFLQHAVILKYHSDSHRRPNTHSYIRKWLGNIFLDSEENVFEWCNHMLTRFSDFQLWRHAQDIKGLKARVLLKKQKAGPSCGLLSTCINIFTGNLIKRNTIDQTKQFINSGISETC